LVGSSSTSNQARRASPIAIASLRTSPGDREGEASGRAGSSPSAAATCSTRPRSAGTVEAASSARKSEVLPAPWRPLTRMRLSRAITTCTS
jgi:hypothetical protein